MELIKKWVYKDFSIDQYDQLDSTNSMALELAGTHTINHNHIILANRQTGGRGRYGRVWQSPAGNLYFSLLLRLNKNIATVSNLSFVAVVSMGLAIEELQKNARNKISYKWPNDILINDKKVAGLLLESQANQGNTDLIVLGIGVNIVSYPKHLEEQLVYKASSLAEQDFDKIIPEKLLEKFLDQFEIIYNQWLNFGFLPIRNLWLKKAHNLGKEIAVNLPSKQVKGRFVDLDNEGNLVLESEGKKILIASGEIF